MGEKNQTSTQKQSFIKVDDQRKENPSEEQLFLSNPFEKEQKEENKDCKL